MGQVSPYPEIEKLLISKEPYDCLWAAALSFNTQQERWLNGALLQVSAEEVEKQVQSLWKTSYKLMKVLHHPDLDGPLKAATTIKTKLDKFRINMLLIKALCSPGIKQRHWNLMSRKVLLEDHVVKTTTMKGSPFIAPFEEQLLSWEARLEAGHG
ncbi:dynein heavy chain 3, axonemal-like isoform X3 [Polyodon spathula]|uniref:dynein heavy chain 3, axonemal-like isoform X3 n=1 Tax=Polyodon spathula TaxID=7913 RepID=UPI001B7D99A2|nr:dynein heavy chain 3, axonemal-like isoform X3 [Polyodon spathula]